MENANIETLSLPWLRSRLGLVCQVEHSSREAITSEMSYQEPVLFDRSIAENIKYGDNSREVTMEQVVEAARQAQTHQLIVSLPEQYETKVGDRGILLSGGEKQRVAIARALIRSPRILLLDEATSALDYETQSEVQDALVTAMSGRTCITVTHQLNSLNQFNMIYVIDRGQVVECRTQEELLGHQGETGCN